MKIRTITLLVSLAFTSLTIGNAQAQGFVFGTAQPAKPEAAAPAAVGAPNAKVPIAAPHATEACPR